MDKKKAIFKKVAQYLNRKRKYRAEAGAEAVRGLWSALLRYVPSEEGSEERLQVGGPEHMSSDCSDVRFRDREEFAGLENQSQLSQDGDREEPFEEVELRYRRSMSQKLGKRVISRGGDATDEFLAADINTTLAVFDEVGLDYNFIERKLRVKKKKNIRSFTGKTYQLLDIEMKRDLSIGVKKLEPIVKEKPFKLDALPPGADQLKERIEAYSYIKKREVQPENQVDILTLKPSIKGNEKNYSLKTFTSVRTKLTLPCFRDTQVHKFKEEQLKTMMHQGGIRDEDCDSSDSQIQYAINKHQENIRGWLNDAKLKREKFKLPPSRMKVPPPNLEKREPRKMQRNSPDEDDYEGYNIIKLEDGWVQLVPKDEEIHDGQNSSKQVEDNQSKSNLKKENQEKAKKPIEKNPKEDERHAEAVQNSYSNRSSPVRAVSTNKQ